MTSESTTVSLHPSPRPYTPEQLIGSPVTGLLVTAIVNPYGPTLNAVVAVGELATGAALPLARVMLNPFAQSVEEVGTLTVGKPWRPAEVLPQLFCLRAGDCPSLILPPKRLAQGRAVEVFGEFLAGFPRARDLYGRVREYYGSPWDRISKEARSPFEALKEALEQGAAAGGKRTVKDLTAQELRTVLERLQAGQARLSPELQPLTADESRDLARLLLDEAHLRPELVALMDAWQGAIDHGPPDADSLPVNSFAGILLHICSAVRLPAFLSARASKPRPRKRRSARSS